MALARYALMRDFTLLDCTWVALLSLLLTWALYKGVEKRRPHLLLLTLLWFLTMALALIIRRTDGLKNYVHVEINAMREYTSTDYKDWEFAPESNWVGPYPKELTPIENHYGDTVLDPKSPDFRRAPVLQIGDAAKQPNFILLGDSYANALFPGFDLIAKQEGWSGLYLNLYMTPFWNRLNVEFTKDEALFTRAKAEQLLGWLEKNPHINHIVIHQQWHGRFQPAETWDGQPISPKERWQKGLTFLSEFCRKIKAQGKDVTFILPTPESCVSHAIKIAPLIQRSKLWYHQAQFEPKIQSSRTDYDRHSKRVRGKHSTSSPP